MKEAMSIKCTQCENILVFNEFPEVFLVDILFLISPFYRPFYSLRDYKHLELLGLA